MAKYRTRLQWVAMQQWCAMRLYRLWTECGQSVDRVWAECPNP